MEKNKPFHRLSLLVIAGFLFLTAAGFSAAGFFTVHTFRGIFAIIALSLLLFIVVLLVGFFGIHGILKSNGGSLTRTTFSKRLALKVFMPLLLGVSSTFDYNKDAIRRVYIRANNEYILSLKQKIAPEKLLVILPHCLQSSQCKYRMRNGLEECHQCDHCNLGDIKAIIQRLGVQVALATGGTSARKVIIDTKPEFVIAVACERDLSSGIMDVKGLPVYGLLNQRPNGPCKDTFVDVCELEERIKYFIKMP